jgi:SAM-dependent methyltransferase
MKKPALIVASLLLSAAWLHAASPAIASGYGDERYQPSVGQEGKDVIWVPTKNELVDKMLETAGVTASDIVYDLGAGDGKIPIAAARNHGAQAVGIEYNADMAALARRNAQRAGVADKVKIIHGDIFVEDFSKATVITLYLLPDLNMRLRPTILKMKPGTRVVSHAFDMGDWEPDRKIEVTQAHAYYWVVPADVAGNWVIDGVRDYPRALLSLTQRFQRIGGNITVGKSSFPLLGAEIEGDKLSFRFIDSKGSLHRVKAKVNGRKLEGEVQTGSLYSDLKGSRQ